MRWVYGGCRCCEDCGRPALGHKKGERCWCVSWVSGDRRCRRARRACVPPRAPATRKKGKEAATNDFVCSPTSGSPLVALSSSSAPFFVLSAENMYGRVGSISNLSAAAASRKRHKHPRGKANLSATPLLQLHELGACFRYHLETSSTGVALPTTTGVQVAAGLGQRRRRRRIMFVCVAVGIRPGHGHRSRGRVGSSSSSGGIGSNNGYLLANRGAGERGGGRRRRGRSHRSSASAGRTSRRRSLSLVLLAARGVSELAVVIGVGVRGGGSVASSRLRGRRHR